ncbi:hypothetical protein ACOMCU_22350 [Lysinibacillus sp. UGB7]|uniref:hypothetical protein n=1 Tax=Lysinibacillus sp. UGB7 TaxID=3411039 RepID=UPI003B7B24C6
MKFSIFNWITFLVIVSIYSLATAWVESLLVMRYISGIIMGVAVMLLIWVVKLIKNQRV